MRPDEDPKLTQGSRSSVKKTETLVTQDQVSSLVGANGDENQDREPLLHVIDNNVGALYLAVDTPQTYREAMRRSDANGWVEAVTEEYNNLHCKGVFEEVEVPPDMGVHEGRLVFTEKIGSTGEVTRKKVRVVAKGFTEVWGKDYWHTYSPTQARIPYSPA